MATQASSLADGSRVKIQIGTTEYLVDTKKIPYFKSFLSFQQNSGQSRTSVPGHSDIPFFEIINYGMSNGFRQFFRRMPTQLSDYHTLCDQLEFLNVDVLEGRKLHGIMSDLRQSKDYCDEYGEELSGLKSIARDSAFRVLYMFLLANFESEVKDSNMAYNLTLFIVSHPSIFKCRTRKMVREAFEERFVVTEKQQKSFNKWSIGDPDEWEESDATTEEDDIYSDYDSDFCSGWSS
ncbi:hypothetical protein F5Y04DRAFT_288695 [Hypomontagnella monticulosa]|nr:hypothetical protein F5Y04DRAFT_288695 [Hypomontagnella monticulosa]